MNIGGFQKSSLIDYPGKISAIIFTQGCNFRCPYCHNAELVNPELFTEPLKVEDILAHINSRRGLLDAVVISGGEPTLQTDIEELLRAIKKMGFFVKLDTNGSNPSVIKSLIAEKLIDYIAMDIKAPLERYQDVVKLNIDVTRIKESIEIIMNSSLDYEFRTTVAKNLLSESDIISIAKSIEGARKYALQNIVLSKTLDPLTAKRVHPYSDQELNEIKNKVEKHVEMCAVR